MKSVIENLRNQTGCSINEAKQDLMINLQLQRHSKALLQQMIAELDKQTTDFDEDTLYLFMMQMAEAYGTINLPREQFKRDELTYLMTQADQEFFWKYVQIKGRYIAGL